MVKWVFINCMVLFKVRETHRGCVFEWVGEVGERKQRGGEAGRASDTNAYREKRKRELALNVLSNNFESHSLLLSHAHQYMQPCFHNKGNEVQEV